MCFSVISTRVPNLTLETHQKKLIPLPCDSFSDSHTFHPNHFFRPGTSVPPWVLDVMWFHILSLLWTPSSEWALTCLRCSLSVTYEIDFSSPDMALLADPPPPYPRWHPLFMCCKSTLGFLSACHTTDVATMLLACGPNLGLLACKLRCFLHTTQCWGVHDIMEVWVHWCWYTAAEWDTEAQLEVFSFPLPQWVRVGHPLNMVSGCLNTFGSLLLPAVIPMAQ